MLRGVGSPGAAAPVLCLLGVSWLSCVAEVPPSSSAPGVIARFDPAASPAVVPAPTDLVRVGGSLQIPVNPAEDKVGALKTFNTYLRSLDGFPPDSEASTTFSDKVDPSSLAEGVVVYDATDKVLIAAPNAVAALDPTSDSKRMVISTTSRWQSGHTYFVGLFAWSEGGTVHGVKGADGKSVIADTPFALLRSATPLFGKCQDSANPACVCTDFKSADCHAVVDGLDNTQAMSLEVPRLALKPIIDDVIALKGRTRQELVMGWSFTISSRSFATFDLTHSSIPFPSNLLLSNRGIGDPKADANVNLPILPTDDARTAGLKTGLNTLDGFSTTGSVQFPVDSSRSSGQPVSIDAATVLPGRTAFLLNLSVPTQQPLFTAKPLQALLDPANGTRGFAGQIYVTPARPLVGDRTTYVAVLTRSIKDANGSALLPAPATLLLTQPDPLIDDKGKSVISTITDVQAEQLEVLREALSPLFAQLSAKGIARDQIAAFTVYRTQSVISPLQKLLGATAQLAGAGAVPTTATIANTYVGPFPPQLSNVGAIVHGNIKVRRVLDLRGPFNSTRLAAATANDDIPFMMTLPKTAAPGGAPVVIAQHGITRWRGDALAMAQAVSTAGMAMIAIDVMYHGGRVVCLSDADCDTGVTCNQPAPVGGVAQAGSCAGAYKPATGATALLGSTAMIPDPSLPSRDFTNLANPFALRDNYRQHALDLFQLVRVLQDATAGGLLPQLAADVRLQAVNPAKIGYIGQSLGSILGTAFLAMNPTVRTAVLNVGGGDVVDMFVDPNSSLSTGVAAGLGVTPETPAYYALLENFRWIMDPGEPLNFARFVRSPDALLTPGRAASKVILQEAGMDTVILNPYTQKLGIELGLPLDGNGYLLGIDQEGTGAANNKTTFFPSADHGALINFTNVALTAQIQSQAVTYLATGMLTGTPTVQ